MFSSAAAPALAAPPAAACRQQRQQPRPTAASASSLRCHGVTPALRRGSLASLRVWAAGAVTAAAGRFEEPSSAAGNVVIEVRPDEASVAAFLCDTVEAAAAKAVAERGVFTLAIPGGSVLKALKGLAGRAMPWDKTRIFFVNHKTVPNEDAATSSYAKARALFLDAVNAPITCVATLGGSDDAQAEAAAYAAALAAAADAAGMERAPSGAPRFDLLLLGVGADGHVGSLYPKGEATLADPAAAPWVQPVVKAKPPASITLSLGVMNAARSVVVCLTGGSKAAAAKLALETCVPRGDFPAQLVQPAAAPAVWLLDEAAAAQLSVMEAASGSAGMPQPDGSILYTF